MPTFCEHSSLLYQNKKQPDTVSGGEVNYNVHEMLAL